MARPRRPEAPRLAGARRRRALRDLLLRVCHPLLPRARAFGPRRPHADPARAGSVRVLARLGARAAAAGSDRHGRRARTSAAARNPDADRSDRQELYARRRDRDPATASLRCERLAERPGQPRPARESADAREARSCDGYIRRRERRPVSPHVHPPARFPAAVQGLADRLDDPRRPLAGGGDRDRPARRRGDRQHRGAARHDDTRVDRRRDLRRRRPEGGAHGRPPAHLREAGARDREGHAREPLRPPAPALVRVLRQATRPAS